MGSSSEQEDAPKDNFFYADSIDECLASTLVQRLLSYSESELNSILVNDVYKPKMHKLYAESYTAVEASWCLNIRKTPFSLERMREEVSGACHRSCWPRPFTVTCVAVLEERPFQGR